MDNGAQQKATFGYGLLCVLIGSFPNALKGTRDDNCPSFNSFWRRKTPQARFDQYLIELIQTYFGAQSDYPGKSRRGTEAIQARERERGREGEKKRGANFTTADKIETCLVTKPFAGRCDNMRCKMSKESASNGKDTALHINV